MDKKKDIFVLHKKILKKIKKMSSDDKKCPLTMNEVSSDCRRGLF